MNASEKRQSFVYNLLLVIVLIAAAFVRLRGSDWGEFQHQHPDELFITSVAANIRAHACMDETLSIDACPPEQQRWMTIGEYFDTENSTLNPANRGNPAYVYGTLPIFIIRYTAEIRAGISEALLAKPTTDPFLLEWAYDAARMNIKLLGRQFSAFADLGTLFLLYLIVKRLYGGKTALLATTFSAFAAMQIQQSHFFTTDLFVNLFGFLAIYFAVLILTTKEHEEARNFSGTRKDTDFTEKSLEGTEQEEKSTQSVQSVDKQEDSAFIILHSKFLWLSIAFGIAFGMALASKVNIYPLALLLPAAFIVRGLADPAERERLSQPVNFNRIIVFLIAGGLAALITFRVFQPYAFDGFVPNQLWMEKIAEQRVQARGDADLPWNLQWARRTHLYSFKNLTVWGLGLPLGILAWVGFLSMAWTIWKGERRHLLLWTWTAGYFIWQSMQFNPTMRYQLPIYPLLAVMAAWFVFEFPRSSVIRFAGSRFTHHASRVIGTIVLVLTIFWGYAFHTIYVRDETRMAASRWIYQNVPAGVNAQMVTADGEDFFQPLSFTNDATILPDAPFMPNFIPMQDGLLTGIELGYVRDGESADARTLSLSVATVQNPSPDQTLAQAVKTVDLSVSDDPRGVPVTFEFDPPLAVTQGEYYVLTFQTDGGNLSLSGGSVINETSYDYGLPFRVDGFDGFSGMYRGDLVLEVYWDDNADKLTRLTNTLDQGDYIFIPTNHQYAQITRLPERYPLTTEYYRQLIGCPEDQNIIACYRHATPENTQGNLGFDLVKVFTSYPSIGGISINDQAAEEAFTFYDHPKVFVFKKSDDYDSAQVAAILGAVDLSHVVHLTPRDAASYKADEQEKDLLLSAEMWEAQRAGGTWTDLFDPDRWVNKVPVLGLLLWYFFIFILGLFTYPIVRRTFPGLADKGYPLARALGLLLLAYISWLLGSVGVTYSRLTIGLVFLGIVFVGSFLFYNEFARQPHSRNNLPANDETASAQERAPRRFIEYLKEEWHSNRRYYLMIEGLFLAFFLIDLAIRIANPDLWHPSKGGERPMDLSYLMAVMKSTSFPPYDPWFAGGYLNYYYFGFVLVGTPIKLLGLTPTTAYNYILPTLFGLVGIGAFSIGWNLVESRKKKEGTSAVPERSDRQGAQTKDEAASGEHRSSTAASHLFSLRSETGNNFLAGLAASAFMLLLGNLGTIRAVYQGLQRIVDSTAHTADISVFKHFWFAMQGLWRMFTEGAVLPLGRGDWYWFPSRVIPAPGDVEPITEFPLFTFLYSDLHAHMIVLPLTLLAVAWALSFLKARVDGKNSFFAILAEITVASLIVGALRPTNTWDLYAYLPLTAVVVGYALFRYSCTRKDADNTDGNQKALVPWHPCESVYGRVFLALAGMGLLAILTNLFYQPYIANFGQAYGEVKLWEGTHTPFSSYFAQWGLMLFVIVSWLWWETHEWMAQTPLSALKKLRPYRGLMRWIFVLLLGVLLGLAYLEVRVGWLAVPLALWAGALILRAELSEEKRLVLFLVGTGLLLTTVVEVIVLAGDIGRMNTVFKLYLQAWTLFAMSAAAALLWLLPEFARWTRNWRNLWQTAFGILLLGAMLFTITATIDKMRDRVQPDLPIGLDGMAYMQSASYWDGIKLDLSQDYAGIQWMRENIVGSPVIVEANTPEYRWGSRYTIYTGLPGVVGWNWHQRQQRALTPTVVTDRVAEVGNFYNTVDVNEAQRFLEKYHVRYIVVGQVESQYYTPEGLAKFAQQDGVLWDAVFQEGETVIYAVK